MTFDSIAPVIAAVVGIALVHLAIKERRDSDDAKRFWLRLVMGVVALGCAAAVIAVDLM